MTPSVSTRKRCGPTSWTRKRYPWPPWRRSIVRAISASAWGRPRRAKAKKLARSSAASVSLVSIAAWSSATSLYARGLDLPAQLAVGRARCCRSRPTAPAGGRAARAGSPGWSCRRGARPSSRAVALRRRASASSRSFPQAISLATIESNSAGISSPSAIPVSTRSPGPGRQPQQLDPARAWARSRAPDPRR